MRVLADTSVIIPALVRAHVHHAAASPYLDRAARGEARLLVSAHATAEAFATLTVMQPQLTPAVALRLLDEGLLAFAEVVSLDADDYRVVLARMASLGLASGAVYDGLHVRAAEKAEANELVTLNGRDFRRMPPAPPCRLVVL